MEETCSFCEAIDGTIYIVTEKSREDTNESYDEFVKKLIKKECVRLDLDEDEE